MPAVEKGRLYFGAFPILFDCGRQIADRQVAIGVIEKPGHTLRNFFHREMSHEGEALSRMELKSRQTTQSICGSPVRCCYAHQLERPLVPEGLNDSSLAVFCLEKVRKSVPSS